MRARPVRQAVLTLLVPGVLATAGCAGSTVPLSPATVSAQQADENTAEMSAPSDAPLSDDPAAVTTGGPIIESLDDVRRMGAGGDDASLAHTFLDMYVGDHGDQYAGYYGSGGPDGVTDGVIYLLASDPVISPNMQEAIDLGRASGMTITIEERELSLNQLWSIADRVAADPDWPGAVVTYGVDVSTTEAVVGLDARLDPAVIERVRAEILARYAPHVRVTTEEMAFGSLGPGGPAAGIH